MTEPLHTPAGGAVPEDYCFEEVAGSGGEVRFSELFETGKDTLVVYSFMFRAPRAIHGRGLPARRASYRSQRLRVRPARRFSTRSTAPPPTSTSG